MKVCVTSNFLLLSQDCLSYGGTSVFTQEFYFYFSFIFISWRLILKEISPGCSLEGLTLKLKLQYFGHLMRRVDSLEKTLMLGGIGAGGEGDNRG